MDSPARPVLEADPVSLKGGSTDIGELEDVPVEPESLSTNQEVIPVPHFAGTRVIAIRWLTQPLNVNSVQAKGERPAKK